MVSRPAITIVLTNDDGTTELVEIPIRRMPWHERPAWWLRCRWTDVRNAVYWLRGDRR